MSRASDLRAVLQGAARAFRVHVGRVVECRTAGRPVPAHKLRASRRAATRYHAARLEAERVLSTAAAGAPCDSPGCVECRSGGNCAAL